MKNLFITIILISFGTTTIFSQNLSTNKDGTIISFQIKNFGLQVDGAFSEFKVKANFDRDNLPNSYFTGTAVIKSINTGIEARNNSLQKKEYFDSKQFPEMTLTSNEIKKLEDGRYEFIGKLSIKGKTQKVTFPITIEEASSHIIAKGDFEINRLDFKVGGSSWVLNKKVKISIIYKGNFN